MCIFDKQAMLLVLVNAELKLLVMLRFLKSSKRFPHIGQLGCVIQTSENFAWIREKRESLSSFPVYQFLRAAIAMSVKGRSVNTRRQYGYNSPPLYNLFQKKERCSGKWSPPWNGSLQIWRKHSKRASEGTANQGDLLVTLPPMDPPLSTENEWFWCMLWGVGMLQVCIYFQKFSSWF